MITYTTLISAMSDVSIDGMSKAELKDEVEKLRRDLAEQRAHHAGYVQGIKDCCSGGSSGKKDGDQTKSGDQKTGGSAGSSGRKR